MRRRLLGSTGCLTDGGHCIRITCRAGDEVGNFCGACTGFSEITLDRWFGGLCLDVGAKYHEVSGTQTMCGWDAPSCCGDEASCAGTDSAWHFSNGDEVHYVGPNLSAEELICVAWNNAVEPNQLDVLRLTACEAVF